MKEEIDSTEKYQQEIEERDSLLWHCKAINQGLENLDARSGERAFWELIQNARDLGEGSCKIRIELSDDSLSFYHRGKPFEFNSLMALVTQNSSKDNPEADVVGRYGTGFMTTHTFNEIVAVSGPFKAMRDKDILKGYVYIPNMILNRSLRHDIEAAIVEMRNEKNEVRKVHKYTPLYPSLAGMSEDKHWTRFKYNIRQEQISEVSKELKRVIKLLPFVMVLNNEIEYVEICDKDERLHVQRNRLEAHSIQLNNSKWYVVKDQMEIKNAYNGNLLSQYELCSLQTRDDDGKSVDIMILPPYPAECGSVDDIPSLFLSFPLLGTEQFGVNFIFHSKRFHPVEKRNNILLPREVSSDFEKKKQDENETVLNEMMDALLSYYANTDHDIELSREMCEVSFERQEEDERTAGFYKRMQSKWKDAVRTWRVIPTREGRKKIEDGKVVVLHPDFYSRLNAEQRTEFEPVLMQFVSEVKYASNESYLLPKEDLIQWSETVAAWGNSRDDYYISIKDVCESIQGNSERLIDFLRFLKDSDNIKALEDYPLFPNRDGILCKKGPMMHADFLDDESFELVKLLMGDDASKIVDKAFVEIAGAGEYTKDHLYKAISGTIGIWRNNYLKRGEEIAMPRTELEALMSFCSSTAQEEFKNIRGRLMEDICKINGYNYERRYLPKMKDTEEELYRVAFNYLVDYTLYVLSMKQDYWLQNNRELLLHFLHEFSTNQGDDWLAKLDIYAVLPNQKWNLCLRTKLHRNIGVVEDLTEIYKKVNGDDLRDVWINAKCEEWYKLEIDTPEAIARQIQEVLHDELVAQQAREHKDVIKRIILRLNEEDWQKWFYEVNERKQAILFDMQSGAVQKCLFELMDLPENQLAELANISERNLLGEMLQHFKDEQRRRMEEAARKEHLMKIGKHVEIALRNEIAEYNLNIDYPGKDKPLVEDKQDGQDIIVYQKKNGIDEPVFYVEVKSKWDFNEAAHMSTRQIVRACKNKDRYALCCVDLRPYKHEDLVNLSEDIIIRQTRVKMEIGNDLYSMMREVLEADEKSDEEQIKIADYRTNIGSKVFEQGEPFNALLERIKEVAQYG